MNRLNNIYNKIAITKALIQYIFNRRILHVRFMDDKTFNFIFTNTIIVLLPPPPRPLAFSFQSSNPNEFTSFTFESNGKSNFERRFPGIRTIKPEWWAARNRKWVSGVFSPWQKPCLRQLRFLFSSQAIGITGRII